MNDPKNMGWDRDRDPQLYGLYVKKLPRWGWAGQKSPEEKAYIKRVKAPIDGETIRGGLFTSDGWRRMEDRAITSLMIRTRKQGTQEAIMEDKTDVDKQQKSNIGGCTGKGWEPGQSGNPKGRPPNELSITNLMRQKLDDVPTELLGKPYTGGKTWRELIAEAALTGAAFGQSAYTKELLDRLEGKVADKVQGEVKVYRVVEE